MDWMQCIDWDKVDEKGQLDEGELWEAVAESLDVDYDEVADRDPFEFL